MILSTVSMIQHHESGWCAYVGGEQLFRSLLNCAKPRKFEDWKLNTSMFFHRFLAKLFFSHSCSSAGGGTLNSPGFVSTFTFFWKTKDAPRVESEAWYISSSHNRGVWLAHQNCEACLRLKKKQWSFLRIIQCFL